MTLGYETLGGLRATTELVKTSTIEFSSESLILAQDERWRRA